MKFLRRVEIKHLGVNLAALAFLLSTMSYGAPMGNGLPTPPIVPDETRFMSKLTLAREALLLYPPMGELNLCGRLVGESYFTGMRTK